MVVDYQLSQVHSYAPYDFFFLHPPSLEVATLDGVLVKNLTNWEYVYWGDLKISFCKFTDQASPTPTSKCATTKTILALSRASPVCDKIHSNTKTKTKVCKNQKQ